MPGQVIRGAIFSSATICKTEMADSNLSQAYEPENTVDQIGQIILNSQVPQESFPFFVSSEEFLLYKRGQSQYFNLLSGIPFILIANISITTRGCLSKFFQMGPLFSVAMAFVVLSVIINAIFLDAIIGQKIFKKGTMIHKYSNLILDSYGSGIQDIHCITAALGISLFLVARVDAGVCEQPGNVWRSQECNPFAESGALPFDAVLANYLLPILVQLTYKSIRIEASVISWSIATACLIASMVLSGAFLMNIWVLLYSVLFLCIIIEFERFMRVSYLQHKNSMRMQSKVIYIRLTTV